MFSKIGFYVHSNSVMHKSVTIARLRLTSKKITFNHFGQGFAHGLATFSQHGSSLFWTHFATV